MTSAQQHHRVASQPTSGMTSVAPKHQAAPAHQSPDARACGDRSGERGVARARSGMGNHAFGRLVQAKLRVGAVGDAFEQEADAVAERVGTIPMGHAGSPAMPGVRSAAPPAVQRTCAECAKEDEEERPVQRTTAAIGGAIGPDATHHVDAMRGGGQPLSKDVRSHFEAHLGADFGAVRVHTDDRAARAAGSLNARAFTTGADVAFAPGMFLPSTPEGRRLIAHELTHVVQQGAAGQARGFSPAPPSIQRSCGSAAIGTPAGCTSSAAEFHADYPFYRFKSECDEIESAAKTRMIADATAMAAGSEIEVHGYASPGGDATYNQNLSCARALTAKKILTDATPGGAGIPDAQVVGVFSHGETAGAASARTGVLLTPRRAAGLPAAIPAAGAADFRIERELMSTTSRIFFTRNSSVLDAADDAKAIADIKKAKPASVELIGHASADEPASVATDRAKEVEKALTAGADKVAVTSATGNAAATESRAQFSGVRSVDVVLPGVPAPTLDCTARDPVTGNLINPPKQDCTVMDPDKPGKDGTWKKFNEALPVANDAMKRAVASVAGTPTGDDAARIDRFFGDHSSATLVKLRTNLANLEKHVNGLPAITKCGGQCDVGKCESGWIGYNTGVDAASTMTICVPTFKRQPLNDRARNLIHESAHGTGPLGGSPGTGTDDVGYRHERMIFQLSPADRQRNSDSYALYALFVREAQMTSIPTAVPADIDTPATDTPAGTYLAGEDKERDLAIAKLEKRMAWAEDWTKQLYGEIVAVRAGTRTWAASWAENLMKETAARFPLTAPPATPVLDDQIRAAGIHERYERMKEATKQGLTLTRAATGSVKWPAGSGFFAGAAVELGPDFFRANAEDQIGLLLEALAKSTRDVEAAYVPAYVSLAAWIHSRNP